MTLIDATFNSAFIDSSEFAVSANPDWSVTDIDGVFFDPGIEIQTAGGIMESTDPVFMIKDADAVGADQGDSIVIATVTYYVIKIMPDGLGMTYLSLSKNASV